jgi:hypothetical protein
MIARAVALQTQAIQEDQTQAIQEERFQMADTQMIEQLEPSSRCSCRPRTA